MIPGSRRSCGEGKRQPTPIFLSRESHGQRSLAGYSPWDCKEQCLQNPSHHGKTSKIRQTNMSPTHPSLTFKEGLETVHTSYWFCAVKQRLVRPDPCPLGDLKMMIKYTYVNNQNKHDECYNTAIIKIL